VIYALLFYAVAALTVVSALGVALSRNVVYSAYSLMGCLLGVAGLYVYLAADFVAGVQVLVYVGGILVLMLFAIKLTHQIADVHVSNRSVGRAPAFLLMALVGGGMATAVRRAPWRLAESVTTGPTTYGIGDSFLSQYLLPFELASIVLLTVLIGAIVISRKELRD
jgi:NAD(P)H-quinone oxidoreductase subunit 6